MYMFIRNDGRNFDQLRPFAFATNFTKFAEGSVLVNFGNTKVICNASVENKVPDFLIGKNQGWLTAEYSMLPRATQKRNERKSKIDGRSQEIQRLIGRSLRSCLDLSLLGEHQIIVDCDVIQADGGTRCASICGGWLATYFAVQNLLEKNIISQNPIKNIVAAISVGIVEYEKNQQILVDLDYSEDSNALTDMNVIMNQNLEIVEIQGTAEHQFFSRQQLNQMLDLAEQSLLKIIEKQKEYIKN